MAGHHVPRIPCSVSGPRASVPARCHSSAYSSPDPILILQMVALQTRRRDKEGNQMLNWVGFDYTNKLDGSLHINNRHHHHRHQWHPLWAAALHHHHQYMMSTGPDRKGCNTNNNIMISFGKVVNHRQKQHIPSTLTSILYTAKLLHVSMGSMKVLSHRYTPSSLTCRFSR